MNNYSSEVINGFCITEALTVVQKQLNKRNVEGGEQAGNKLVRTIGTLFINGYYGRWRTWTGQLTLCTGSRNKKKGKYMIDGK